MKQGRMQGRDEEIKLSGGQRENEQRGKTRGSGAPYQRHINYHFSKT